MSTANVHLATNNGDVPFNETGYASLGFITVCAALVFIMTPGLGFFYSGLSAPKNALTLIMLSMLSMAIVTFQWFIFGFSLSFSETGSPFIGNSDFFGMKNLGASALPGTAPAIPGIAFSLYQLMFATVTPAIIFGSVSERVRILPNLIFLFCWTTLVYDPVAYWSWANRGWIRNMSCISSLYVEGGAPCQLGSLDFAGGGPVHVASGFAGLAYCLLIGKRRSAEGKPHNVAYVFLGTALLWFGWFGFNGGGAVAATPRAAMAAMVTTLCASVSAMTWCLFDYIFTRKLSGIGFCTGAVVGLVVITPASGFVAPWAAVVMGIIAGILINLACRLKPYLGLYDDTLDAFGAHGLGGFLGSTLTGIFHQKWVAKLDGTNTLGSAIDGFPTQIGYQIAGSLAIASYSFVVSFIILFVINKIPGLHLRYTETEERLGADMVEMGEVAYSILPSEMIAEVSNSTPVNRQPSRNNSKHRSPKVSDEKEQIPGAVSEGQGQGASTQ